MFLIALIDLINLLCAINKITVKINVQIILSANITGAGMEDNAFQKMGRLPQSIYEKIIIQKPLFLLNAVLFIVY